MPVPADRDATPIDNTPLPVGNGHFSRRLPAGLLLIALVLAVGGCGKDSGTSLSPAAQPDFSKLQPTCFVGGGTPQLDLSGPVLDWTWNDPHVLKVGDQYWMYASATDNFVFPVRLYRLVSNDGENWTLDPPTPILTEGGSGEWDVAGAETPAVVYFNGLYHLFYTGYTSQPDIFSYRIGHATSSDGVNFTKDPANPVVSPSAVVLPDTDFRQYIVAEPAPVVVGNTLRLYFTAVGADLTVGTTLQTIGVTEFDGSGWSTPVEVLAPDQALYPRAAGWVGYSTPNAVVLDGAVHLFFDVAYDPTGSDWQQVRLHHAWSADGYAGWTQDSAPIFKREDFGWTAQGIRSPAPYLDGTTLRLYFAGDNLDAANPPPVPHFGIGEATCNLSP